MEDDNLYDSLGLDDNEDYGAARNEDSGSDIESDEELSSHENGTTL